jgi:transposase
MSKTKRKRYSAEFKAKVALEAIKGEQTIQELGSRYGLHPNLITNWKRQAIENLAETFSTKTERSRTNDDPQIKELHAKIGQLTVERDFLANAFGRIR